MRIQLKTLALTGVLLLPSALVAQAPGAEGRPGGRGAPRAQGPGAGPRGEMPAPGVTQILNARRHLDLTARQVAQLDSMERVLWTERERLRAQAEPQRDSLRTSMRQQMERGARPRQDSAARATMRREAEERMARLRPQMQALRQRDSTTRIAAERVLTDGQRTKLREMQAERRGFERGRREGMQRDMRGGARGGMRGGMHGGMRGGMQDQRGRPGPRPDGMRPPQRPE